MTRKFLKKGTVVYRSELGHKNFHYPSDKSAVLTSDFYASKLPWVGSSTLSPVKIPEDIIDAEHDMISPSLKSDTVVWVEK